MRATIRLAAAALLLGCAVAEGPGREPAPAPLADGWPPIASLWDFGDPAATRQRMQQVLERGPEDAYRLGLLTQIARTHGIEGRLDTAHQVLDGVEAELASAPEGVRVSYLLERGRVLSASGSRERARPLFIEAWERASSASLEDLAVDAAHMVAIAEEAEERLAWNLRALDYAERATDPGARRWLGALYNNIGWDHHDAGRYGEALELWERGLAWRVSSGASPQSVRVARWTIARALRSLGHVDEALARQRELLVEYEAAGQPSGFVLEELAECLLALGRDDEARPYFARAHDALAANDSVVQREPQRLERLRRLGAE